jgi:hypothetical protein
MELPEGLTQPQLDAKVHETFGRLRDVVESELNGNGAQAGGGQGAPGPVNGNGNGRGNNGHRNGNGRKISNAQAKFALDLARKVGIKLTDLDQIARDEFGADNLYGLGAGQASSLIESLKARQAA